MFPRCPDCSCEHKEKCVQHDDVEEAVRELKERIKNFSKSPEYDDFFSTQAQVYEAREDIIIRILEVVDEVLGEVNS